MMVLALAFAGVGCPCIRGPVNSSEAIRWWLFSQFGAQKICPEMTKKGVPLKMGGATVGRFFPTQCNVQLSDPDRSMAVAIAGSGYAFLPMARRVGFTATARVEFRPDFRLESDATYVWGRFSRMIEGPTLRVTGVENGLVNLAFRTPLGDVATVLGQGIAQSEISRGFTVVRGDDGDEFALGILTPPEKPSRAFIVGNDHKLLGGDSVDIHASEREYLGPFEITDKGQGLFVKTRTTGAPLTALLVDRALGDAWRQPYENGQPLAGPPGPPIASGTIAPGDSTQFFPLPPGLYYVVVENRAAMPQVPFGLPLPVSEPVGSLTWSVEVGDKP
jgi:hypothetical protein